MQSKRRWIASAIATARTVDVRLPWERGARRAEWIAHRNGGMARRTALSA